MSSRKNHRVKIRESQDNEPGTSGEQRLQNEFSKVVQKQAINNELLEGILKNKPTTVEDAKIRAIRETSKYLIARADNLMQKNQRVIGVGKQKLKNHKKSANSIHKIRKSDPKTRQLQRLVKEFEKTSSPPVMSQPPRVDNFTIDRAEFSDLIRRVMDTNPAKLVTRLMKANEELDTKHKCATKEKKKDEKEEEKEKAHPQPTTSKKGGKQTNMTVMTMMTNNPHFPVSKHVAFPTDVTAPMRSIPKNLESIDHDINCTGTKTLENLPVTNDPKKPTVKRKKHIVKRKIVEKKEPDNTGEKVLEPVKPEIKVKKPEVLKTEKIIPPFKVILSVAPPEPSDAVKKIYQSSKKGQTNKRKSETKEDVKKPKVEEKKKPTSVTGGERQKPTSVTGGEKQKPTSITGGERQKPTSFTEDEKQKPISVTGGERQKPMSAPVGERPKRPTTPRDETKGRPASPATNEKRRAMSANVETSTKPTQHELMVQAYNTNNEKPYNRDRYFQKLHDLLHEDYTAVRKSNNRSPPLLAKLSPSVVRLVDLNRRLDEWLEMNHKSSQASLSLPLEEHWRRPATRVN